MKAAASWYHGRHQAHAPATVFLVSGIEKVLSRRDLVTDVGQKLALRATRRFCSLPRQLERVWIVVMSERRVSSSVTAKSAAADLRGALYPR